MVKKHIWLILFGGLVLALMIARAVIEARAAGEGIADRSTYRYNTLGTRALYETLHRLGYPVERCKKELLSLPEDVGEFWILYPTRPFGRGELRTLRKWVARGNTLVCAYDQFGFANVFAHGGPFKPSAAQKQKDVRHSARSVGYRPEFAELESIRPQEQEILSLILPTEPAEGEGDRLSPRIAHELASDVSRIYVPNRLRVYPTKRHTEVAGDRTGSVVVIVPVEEGRIVSISDPDIYANKFFLEEDNVILAANIAHMSGGKKILFDEFHHGFAEIGSLAQLAWASASRWGILQMLLATILLLVVRMRRFGRAMPMPLAQRRVTREYVEALAEVYRAAQAREVAVWTLYQFARRRLAALAGLPPEVEDDMVAQHAASRLHRPAEEIRRALAEARQLSATCPDDAALIRVAQRLRGVVEASDQMNRDS